MLDVDDGPRDSGVNILILYWGLRDSGVIAFTFTTCSLDFRTQTQGQKRGSSIRQKITGVKRVHILPLLIPLLLIFSRESYHITICLQLMMSVITAHLIFFPTEHLT